MSDEYALTEIFDSIQGEGYRTGDRSVFVRFSGCNLWFQEKVDCSKWCDTDFRPRMQLSAAAILQQMSLLWPTGNRWCVLTGGEPLLQLNLDLLRAIKGYGWKIAVETNGSLVLPWSDAKLIDWLTVSPKIGAPLLVSWADEVKVVVGQDTSWTPVLLAELPIGSRRWYIQPRHVADSVKFQANVKMCMEALRWLPGWRLSVQAHKALGLP